MRHYRVGRQGVGFGRMTTMRQRTQVVNATVSASVAVDVAQLLHRNGTDPEPVFEQAAVDLATIRDPYAQISLTRYTYLLQLASEAANQPGLGLELGLHQDPTKWGAFGYVVLNSPTVGAALNNMATFLKPAQGGTHMAYAQRDNAIGIEYSIIDPRVSYKAQDAEFAIGYVKHVVDRLCERHIEPVHVYFEHNPLCELEIYRSCLGVIPLFDQPVNAIFFPRHLEDRLVLSADLQLFPIVKQHLADLAGAMPDEKGIVELVAYQVRQYLSSGQCKLENIARDMALTPRTLQRRLQEEGTSFARIVEGVRRELALQYIDNAAMEIKEISYLLGFYDTSAFIKAFRKWTGETPGHYRGD